LLKYIQNGSVQFYALTIIAAAIGIVIYRVTPEGFYYYLAGLIIMLISRLLARVVRTGRIKAEANIED